MSSSVPLHPNPWPLINAVVDLPHFPNFLLLHGLCFAWTLLQCMKEAYTVDS